jgi:ankyrin repeat protein
MSKFRKPKYVTDQPYVTIINYDKSKIGKLFTEAENLNIYNLKKISLTDKIPLDVSIEEDGSNLIHHILKKPSNSQNQKINLIKFLIENNVNPDQPDINNNTPLHYACQNQEDEIIKYLLEIGCNPNFKNNLGMTPFHYYLTGIYKERILEKDFLSVVKVKDPLDLEQLDLDASLNQLIENDDELKALNETIFNLLDDINLTKKLQEIEIKEKFDLLQVKGFLSKYIDTFIKNIFDFEKLKIHEKTTNSLPTNHPSLSVLENTNISNILKTNIKKSIEEIKELLVNTRIVPDLDEMDINNYFTTYTVDDTFTGVAPNTPNSHKFYIHNNKYLFFASVPANNINPNILLQQRINYLQELNPAIEVTYIRNQCNKINYLRTIINIDTGNEDIDFKDKIKKWLFILMDEGEYRNIENLYENIKNINEEVIFMNRLIDTYVDNGFKYDDRIKILERLLEQKKTRLFLNDLLFTDTIFILKTSTTTNNLNYYFSVMMNVNNLNIGTIYDTLKNFNKLLPSINPELLTRGNVNNKKIHNYAYFFNFYILRYENFNLENIVSDDLKKIHLGSVISNHSNVNLLVDFIKKKFSEVGIKNYHKIAPEYLGILNYANYHYSKILDFLGKHINNRETTVLSIDKLDKIADKMNNINCNYFVYYYFYTNNKRVKIPKFYLYKIPKSGSKDLEFTGNLVYNSNIDLLSLTNFGNNVLYDNLPISTYSGIIINSLYNYSDDDDIYRLYIPYIEINDFYRFNKDNNLPQSMWNNDFLKIFMDIYFIKKYTEIINNNFGILQNLVKYKIRIPSSEKEILDKHTIGLKLKEIVKNKIVRNVNEYINNKLLNLVGNRGILMSDIETTSNFKINLNDINLKYRNITDLLYYEYDLKPPIEKHFLIYSDDYSSSQIEKSLLESKINKTGLKHLLENGASLSIEDNYGKNPLENVIKNLNTDIYQELLELLQLKVDLTTFNNKKILDYFLNNINTHIDKYIGSNNINNNIVKFSLDQGNDIDIRVKTISPQLNNKNYLLSYKIVNYITNQLIGVLNINYNKNDDFYNLLDISTNIPSLLLGSIPGFSDNNNLLIFNLINNLEEKYIKYIEEKNKLISLGKTTDNLDLKINEIARILQIVVYPTKSTTYFYDITSVDLNFIDKYGFYNNLVELEMFNDLFKSGIDKDNLVILPRVLIKEKEFLNNLNVENWRNYKVIANFYSKLADEVEKYFVGNQFRINNELKEFVFKVLVYLTKTVIISQIELLVRKVLTEYFDNTYPNSVPNLLRTTGVLYNNTFTGNNESNINKLYNLAEKLVINSVYIYKDDNEKDTFTEKSIENLLDEWLIETIKSGAINVDENDEFISKLKIELNNFGFIKNIINNWLVVIENNFKFIINHSRLLKMLDLTISNT